MALKIILAGHGSGNPSTKNMNDYCSMRQSSGRGLVEVLRFPGLNDNQRKQMHDWYKTLLGRNVYNQGLREYCYQAYKGVYYSDCSSSICKTAYMVGVISGAASSWNTASMHYNLVKVAVIIKNGIIQNPEVLKVGDCLMFKGSDPSRPLGIGHVEMVYEISGTSGGTTITTTATANNNGSEVENTMDVLRKGSNGHQVGVIQNLLNAEIKAGLIPDKDFGKLTENAVINYQKVKGLEPDGIVGKNTWNKLLKG